MGESERMIQGFEFKTQSDYENAKKEYEVITYLRANTDFSNVKVIYKLYEKLIEKDSFHTIIGYQFLSELRGIVIRENEEFTRVLTPIPIKMKTESKNKKKQVKSREEEGKYKLLYDDIHIKRKRTMIINGFLVVIIAAMMVITLKSNHASTAKLETALQNKYASWQEELKIKEQALEEREKNLNKK